MPYLLLPLPPNLPSFGGRRSLRCAGEGGQSRRGVPTSMGMHDRNSPLSTTRCTSSRTVSAALDRHACSAAAVADSSSGRSGGAAERKGGAEGGRAAAARALPAAAPAREGRTGSQRRRGERLGGGAGSRRMTRRAGRPPRAGVPLGLDCCRCFRPATY
jgi:hypothetical protein